MDPYFEIECFNKKYVSAVATGGGKFPKWDQVF
jgi:hypothetical protein